MPSESVTTARVRSGSRLPSKMPINEPITMAATLRSVPRPTTVKSRCGEYQCSNLIQVVDLDLVLVAQSTNGEQMNRVGRILFNFGPKPLNMDIKRFGVSNVIGTPHSINELGSGEDSA